MVMMFVVIVGDENDDDDCNLQSFGRARERGS